MDAAINLKVNKEGGRESDPHRLLKTHNMKKETFERRCDEMRRSRQPLPPPPQKNVSQDLTQDDGRRSLKYAADKLGVSYWTARRIFISENVRRYSAGGEAPVYPETSLKRFQSVRMTFVIYDADIARVIEKMRGNAI